MKHFLKILCIIMACLVLFTACAGPDTPDTPETPDTPDTPTTPDTPFTPTKVIEENPNYSLWNGTTPIQYTNLTVVPREKMEIINCIKTYGKASFMHAISFEIFERDGKEIMVAVWAYNKQAENQPGEQAMGAFSYDGGKTWSKPFEFKSQDPKYSSTSHGVVWYYDNNLYAMIPCTNFGESPWYVQDDLWKYNFETQQWEFQNTCAFGFWPTSKPVKMEDGNWIVGGPLYGGTMGRAITEGDDFSNWKAMKVNLAKNEYKFSETGMAVNGNMVVLIGRNEKYLTPDTTGIRESRYELAVAVSYDYGKTFTRADISGVYSSPSKPACGTLSDGRFYMVWSMDTIHETSRKRLCFGIGDPDTGSINKIYTLDYYNGSISYPYVMEYNGYIYVGYSESIERDHNGNQNNFVLAKIALSALEVK